MTIQDGFRNERDGGNDDIVHDPALPIDHGADEHGGNPLHDDTVFGRSDETGVDEPVLVEEDDALPWLESDYDDEDQGVDTSRIIGFVLLSLVALALILAAIWYFMRDAADPDLQPEGSLIAAPEGPVRERPADAGGQTFEGTGNVAPTVGEGRTTEGRLADDATSRAPIDAATTAEPTGDNTSSGGVGVQVGAYSTRDSANAAWVTLRGQTEVLQDARNRVVEGQVDGSTVYRLQAIAGDMAAANRLCDALKNDGIACQVKR